MTLAPLRVSESAQTAALSVTHAPIGKGGTNWITKSKPGNTGELPAYIQNVRNAIMRGGEDDESTATSFAIGRVEDWAEGKGHVSPEVKAASAKAIAELKAMGAAAKVKSAVSSSVKEANVDRLVRDQALSRLALIEQEIGLDGIVALLEGFSDDRRMHTKVAGIQEAVTASWKPDLKRVASAPGEKERHDVVDGSQTVGTIACRPAYSPKEPDRWSASAVNGDRVGDYSMKSKGDAVSALQKHLEEAPARVAPHRDGKFLIAKPSYGAGPMTYQEYPSEATARFAAGLPADPTTPEQNSQVEALGEMLTFDLLMLSSVDIPPLRRVQEARRRVPFV